MDYKDAIRITLPDQLPPVKEFRPGIRRAPDRGFHLTEEQTKVALKNALRYIPPHLHGEIAPEFLEELRTAISKDLIALMVMPWRPMILPTS